MRVRWWVSLAGLRVQGVADDVAEHDEAEHGQGQRSGGEEQDARVAVEGVLGGRDVRAPGDDRRGQPDAQMERNQALIAANGEKIRAIEGEIAAINERSEALRREETESDAEAKRIEAAIQPAEGRLTAYDQSAAAAQSDFQSAQQRSAAAEKSLMVAQLEVSRLQNGLDSLKSRIEEDFGLVSFDFDE